MATQMVGQAPPFSAASRAEYEDFLFHEAALLDAWCLEEWLALFTDTARYEVPTAGSSDTVSSATSLFYIADDRARLGHRIARLMKKGAHAEQPRSHTARMITNVRILGQGANGTSVGCTFVTYRTKQEVTDAFFGHHRYEIVGEPGAMRIALKRTHIDTDNLRQQRRVSIII